MSIIPTTFRKRGDALVVKGELEGEDPRTEEEDPTPPPRAGRLGDFIRAATNQLMMS